MATPFTYSPKRITGSFQPNIAGAPSIPFLGYMDGEFIECAFNAEAVTVHVGSDGNVTYVLNADKTAKCTLRIVQGSITNDQLSAYVPDARRGYLPTGTLSFQDLDGNSLVHDANSVIMKMAEIKFGKEVVAREWVFTLADAEINAGGSAT